MRIFAFLLSSIFFVNFVFATVECRLQEDGEIVYGDLDESMCAHLGGVNMNALGFNENPKYSGSMNESRFLFTELMFARATGTETDSRDDLKKIVQCRLVDGDEEIIGSLSRFMCEHLAGEEITKKTKSDKKVSQKFKQTRRKSNTSKTSEKVEVECRIEDQGALYYADMTRFMCSHLSGVVLDDLKLSKNPHYNGSIHSSRFMDDHPKAIVKCHIKDENDEITGDISRFMCDHLGGTIVTDAVEEIDAPITAETDDLGTSFDEISGMSAEEPSRESPKDSLEDLIKQKVPGLTFYNASLATGRANNSEGFDPHQEVLLFLRDNGMMTLDSHMESDQKNCWFIHGFDQFEISYRSLDKLSKKHIDDGSGFRNYFFELRDYIEDKTGQSAEEYIRDEKRKVKKIAKKLGCKY